MRFLILVFMMIFTAFGQERVQVKFNFREANDLGNYLNYNSSTNEQKEYIKEKVLQNKLYSNTTTENLHLLSYNQTLINLQKNLGNISVVNYSSFHVVYNFRTSYKNEKFHILVNLCVDTVDRQKHCESILETSTWKVPGDFDSLGKVSNDHIKNASEKLEMKIKDYISKNAEFIKNYQRADKTLNLLSEKVVSDDREAGKEIENDNIIFHEVYNEVVPEA